MQELMQFFCTFVQGTMKKRLIDNGSWALLTGASRGIGFELARGLVVRGYRRVVLVARSSEGLGVAREQLLAEGAEEVVTLAIDLAERGAAQRLYDECAGRGLEVEVLVNNAGCFAYRDVCDVETERVGQMLSLHVEATTLLCRLFARDMRTRGRGYILNISSYASWFPLAGLSLYAPTKAYVREFSYALREELRDYGVGVTVAVPAGVATDLYGLPKHYQRLGVRLGVLSTPRRVASRCLAGLFRGRRSVGLGMFYRALMPLLRHLPHGVKKLIKRKTLVFQK